MTTCNHCGAPDGLSEEERAAWECMSTGRKAAGWDEPGDITGWDTPDRRFAVAVYRAARAPLEAKVRELDEHLATLTRMHTQMCELAAERARKLKELEAQLAARGKGLPAVDEPIEFLGQKRGMVKVIWRDKNEDGKERFGTTCCGVFLLEDEGETWRRIPAQASASTAHHGPNAEAKQTSQDPGAHIEKSCARCGGDLGSEYDCLYFHGVCASEVAFSIMAGARSMMTEANKVAMGESTVPQSTCTCYRRGVPGLAPVLQARPGCQVHCPPQPSAPPAERVPQVTWRCGECGTAGDRCKSMPDGLNQCELLEGHPVLHRCDRLVWSDGDAEKIAKKRARQVGENPAKGPGEATVTNKCNLHEDCAAADEAVREVLGNFGALHCRDPKCMKGECAKVNGP